MKLFLRFLLVMGAALLLPMTSCSGGDDDDPSTPQAATVTITPEQQSVSCNAGSVTVRVVASAVPSLTTDVAWCKVSGRTIEGTTYTYTLTIDANTSAEERVAHVKASAGSQSATASITQSAADNLVVQQSSYEIGADGGTIMLHYQATGQASVSSEASWITIQRTRALIEDSTALTIAPNYGDTRLATVTVTMGQKSDNVTIRQEKGYRRVTLDLQQRYQTIEGFSASDCWSTAVIGKYWTSKREGMAELLFSREVVDHQPKGIGLSMWRSNLGGGSAEQGLSSDIGVENGANSYNYYRRGESYLNNNLTYDWSRCEGQRYFLDQAKRHGVEKVVLFSNSPNVQFSANGKAYSSNGHKANLKSDCYDDFAEYMATVAQQYLAWGYPVSHISPVNEPQYDWSGHDQEGSGWSNSEIAKITKELDKALTAKGLDVQILLGEGADWNYAFGGSGNANKAIQNFWSSASSNYVGNLSHLAPVYGAHSYWTDSEWGSMRSTRKTAAQEAQNYGIGLWQTEWSMLGDNYQSPEWMGYDNATDLDIALYMDKVIHNDLTVGQISCWSFWTAMDVSRWGQKDRFMLIDFTPAGGTYSVDLSGEGTYAADPTLWVLGNYSLFVRPGAVRIGTDVEDTRYFFSSAYLSADDSQVIAIYSNLSDEEERIGLSADNQWHATSAKAYTTAQGKRLYESDVDLSATLRLPAKSVTTVVYQLQ